METEPLCPSCGRPKNAGNIHGDWCDDPTGLTPTGLTRPVTSSSAKAGSIRALAADWKALNYGRGVLMDATLSIEVEKADGAKCPRCWHYHTVQGNPQSLCDRCVLAILEGLPDWVAIGSVSQKQADEFCAEIALTAKQWKR